MGCIRPATPGFIATLTATILLAIVSFCVPYFKSVYFLKASTSVGGQNATITFGTLGYCFDLNGNVTCSKPSVGYELDINSLVGNNTRFEIPEVAVKWLTYVLVLHIVALAFSAGSAVFGLLAHVREMSMMCCSTCVSGFAAVAAMLAFIFDLALFFVAKSRINAVGSASIGNAIWLTLAAWVLLFFSGCFYTIGRCCISKRKPRNDWDKPKDSEYGQGPGGSSTSRDVYAEQMRMDAVKADQARKTKQKEVGLPAFYESQPLTGRVDGDTVYTDDYRDAPTSPVAAHRKNSAGGYAGGGYMQQPASNRAVDEFYHPTDTVGAATSYPPQPRRQASAHSYATSNYPPSAQHAASPPPMPTNQYLAAGQTAGAGREYGHGAGGSAYYSAHEQQASYTQYDPYAGQADPYAAQTTPQGYNSHATSYYTPTATPAAVPDRSYTLGGDGYGQNSVPPLQERSPSVPAMPDHPTTAGYVPYSTGSPAPSMPKGGPSHSPQYDDSPPGYDPGTGAVQGAWGKH